MPNAIGAAIADSDLKDLGIHTEMLVDAYYKMFQAGKITNSKKNIDKAEAVFGFAQGSSELYEWARENPGLYQHLSITATTRTTWQRTII